MKLEVDVHVYVHDAHDENPLLKLLIEKVTQMAVDLTALTAAVAAEDTVIDSAITLIGGIPQVVSDAVKAALLAAGTADAAAQTAADAAAADIQGKTTALQTALTANTPTPAPTA
jgi:hypothetical protein